MNNPLVSPHPLRIFIGWDSKEAVAFHTLAHSIITRASKPVQIMPLCQQALRNAGVYTRERGPTESTEFSLTRFLVPWLSRWSGISIFMDCDMLCLTDIHTVLAHVACGGNYKAKAVWVCQHDYIPKTAIKMDGQAQTTYPRKNWSSFMVFDNAFCQDLTPEYVNKASGLDLHRFNWTSDEMVGEIPLEWNWLVDEYEPNPDAKVLHYTLGGPWFKNYEGCGHAKEWCAERDAAMGMI